MQKGLLSPGAGQGEIFRRSPGVLASLCIIVRNEEAYPARCIESAREALDEIVLVDTGSTDGTVEVARRLGATGAPLPVAGRFRRGAQLCHRAGQGRMDPLPKRPGRFVKEFFAI